MNLISGTHHSCERREHAFMVLRKYTIISHIYIYILERMKFYSLENIYGFDKIELHYPLILFIQLIN